MDGEPKPAVTEEPSKLGGTLPETVPSQAYPVSVYYVDPMQYIANHVQFVRDRAGKTRLNAILLPPDLPPATGISDLNSGGFLGAASCAECHQEYYDSYVQTSHYKTSAKADRNSILGSFEPSKNRVDTKSPNLRFEMESEDGVFLQRMLVESGGEAFGADFQFGIVTGSGKIAQSYLYWNDEPFSNRQLYPRHILRTLPRWVIFLAPTNSPVFYSAQGPWRYPNPQGCVLPSDRYPTGIAHSSPSVPRLDSAQSASSYHQ